MSGADRANTSAALQARKAAGSRHAAGRSNPLISVVIPVYNVENYLVQCLDSVLSQTYDNFEVVLVDDGSTDGSGKLCDEYAAKDARFKVYHKPNGGLSDARNFGVAHAKAELISFIDSDDYVTADYLECLWHLMDIFGCDISCADRMSVSDGVPARLKNVAVTEVELDRAKSLERICCTSFGAWARLYNKQILLKHPFPVGKLYEDIATIHKLIDECGSVAFSDKLVYFWMQREGSITHSGISEKQLDLFWALDELYNYMYKNHFELRDAASYRYVMETVVFLFRVFHCCDAAERRKYFEFAREKARPHLKAAYRRKEASFQYKMAILGLYGGYFPYKVMLALRKLKKSLGNAID